MRQASALTYATNVKHTHKQKRGLMAQFTASLVQSDNDKLNMMWKKSSCDASCSSSVSNRRHQSCLILDRSYHSRDMLQPSRAPDLHRIITISAYVQNRKTRMLRGLNTIQGKAEKNGGGLVTQSCPTLAAPWTATHQAPLSMGFLRQEY